MIVRMTLGCSNYRDVMESFVSRFEVKMLFYTTKNVESAQFLADGADTDTATIVARRKMLLADMLCHRAIDYTTNEELKSEAMRDIFSHLVKECFGDYVKVLNVDYADYLIKNFQVSVLDSMEDKFEGGEVWYWFQQSHVYINQ